MDRNSKKVAQILQDLEKKMVFIVGTRQVGKTWLSKKIAERFSKTVYLNYDFLADRESIDGLEWPQDTELLIFDELHKKPDWKNYLKGLYDTKPEGLRILVTGSARLDTFRQSGDSLVGRFFAHHLAPFSLAELKQTKYKGDMDRLIERGGFPEAFLADSSIDAQRWRRQYLDGLIRTDILDFENIHDFKAMQALLNALRAQVGSVVSYSRLAKIAGISPTTARKYVEILQALFIIFLVPPFTHKIPRALGKEAKVYFYDTGLVEAGDGEKFENMMAVSLLKHLDGKKDLLGEDSKLMYIRTKEKKEVDFALISGNLIEELVEVKLSDDKVSSNLIYFLDRYDVKKAVQVVKNLRNNKNIKGVEVIKAKNYLSGLFL